MRRTGSIVGDIEVEFWFDILWFVRHVAGSQNMSWIDWMNVSWKCKVKSNNEASHNWAGQRYS